MRRNRKDRMFIAFVVLAMINLMMATRSPGWEQIRNIDIVRLLATGMLLGAALTGFLVSRRSSGPE